MDTLSYFHPAVRKKFDNLPESTQQRRAVVQVPPYSTIVQSLFDSLCRAVGPTDPLGGKLEHDYIENGSRDLHFGLADSWSLGRWLEGFLARKQPRSAVTQAVGARACPVLLDDPGGNGL